MKQMTHLEYSKTLIANFKEGWRDRYPWGHPGFERLLVDKSSATDSGSSTYLTLSTPDGDFVSVYRKGKSTEQVSVSLNKCIPLFDTLDSLCVACRELSVPVRDILPIVFDSAEGKKNALLVEEFRGMLLEFVA